MNKILYAATPLILAGCTAAELKETAGNAKDAVTDAVGGVLRDPSTLLTPTGVLVVAGSILAGFFSKQTLSLSKWAASGTGGWLARLLGKLRSEPKE